MVSKLLCIEVDSFQHLTVLPSRILLPLSRGDASEEVDCEVEQQAICNCCTTSSVYLSSESFYFAGL